MSTGMGMVYAATITFTRCYTVDLNGNAPKVIERQMADFVFSFDRMEWNRNITVFMTHTVCYWLQDTPACGIHAQLAQCTFLVPQVSICQAAVFVAFVSRNLCSTCYHQL